MVQRTAFLNTDAGILLTSRQTGSGFTFDPHVLPEYMYGAPSDRQYSGTDSYALAATEPADSRHNLMIHLTLAQC